MRYWIVFIITLFIFNNNIYAQSRWVESYLTGENPFGESICEFYDNGYLLAGRYGPNYPEYCWLIKTDINGEVLWNKVLGNGNDLLVISSDVKTNSLGETYLVGLTNSYNTNDYDPIIMKLNSCGEKEWCTVFIEEGNNFSNTLEITSDGSTVLVLRYMNPDVTKDRICLAKLSNEGVLIWKKCYNSPDTNLYNEDAKDITICPDNGFLITGLCDYKDPNPPHYLWTKPYYIKTDSLGNFEWETVVHSESNDPGGRAWSTIISPDSNYYYSFISHYYHNPTKNAPAMVKMDMQGQVIGIYDLADKNYYGVIFEAVFITDSTIAGSASWGSEEQGVPKAVIFDTLGNILDSAFLLDNNYMSYIKKTFDNKLLFFTNKYNEESDEFDAYLFKLNTELEDDSIYTQTFNYDSLCPYQIASDTIVQDNCGLIVGMEELKPEKEEERNGILIYPNPAQNNFKVQCLKFKVGFCVIEVFDIFGRKVKEKEIPKGQNKIEVDVEGWRKGLYLVRVRVGQIVVGSEKVIVN